MLDPPYLELQYFVGQGGTDRALRKIVKDIEPGTVSSRLLVPMAVGIIEKPEEVEMKGGVLVLRTEGEAFCGTFRNERERLKRLGRKVYERFLQVADIIDCSYAAILVEYSLEEPADLRRDPRSLAFLDAFLSLLRMDAKAVEAAIQLAGEDAYVERRETGVYISMTSEFNPEGRGIPALDAQERSVRIAAVVGRAVR